jgi:hypothetical protein
MARFSTMVAACKWPGCASEAPHNGNFCCDHYFAVDEKDARVLLRMRLDALRNGDAEDLARVDAYARRAAQKAIERASQHAAGQHAAQHAAGGRLGEQQLQSRKGQPVGKCHA